MQKVLTGHLKTGMKVSLAVFNAEGIILLQQGQVLTQKYIDRLHRAGIPFVYVNDDELSSEVIMDIVSAQTRAEAVRTLREWIFNSEKNRLMKDEGSPHLSEIITNLVNELRDNPDRCIKFFDIRSLDDFSFGHSVNVCILSLVTGLSLGMTDEELTVLGMSALLHDIGKLKISREILSREGLYGPEDYRDMIKHTHYGYKTLMEDPTINPLIAEIVYQHHERYNGSGYPRRLRGDQIHPCAYIIGVADVYDALTNDRSYREKYLPHEAIEYLYGSGNLLFEYKVVRAFVEHIALYPIGTAVELSTKEQGTVINIRPKLTGRPVVRVIRDENGNSLYYPKVYDLAQEPTLMITKVLG